MNLIDFSFEQKTINFISQHQGNPTALQTLFTALVLLLKIFYSLNCIDLPEFFEDHMEEFMTLFQGLLKYDVKYPELIGVNLYFFESKFF